MLLCLTGHAVRVPRVGAQSVEGRGGLSVKMLWKEDIPEGEVCATAGKQERGRWFKEMCLWGGETPSVRQGMVGVWSVGSRLQWPSM